METASLAVPVVGAVGQQQLLVAKNKAAVEVRNDPKDIHI